MSRGSHMKNDARRRPRKVGPFCMCVQDLRKQSFEQGPAG
jgi:hypothetical protein